MILWVGLLFIAGILLIFAEFFLPGLVLGTLGALMIIVSTVLGVYHYPEYAVFIVIGEVVGASMGIVLGFVVLSRTKAGGLLIQKHAQTAESGYVSAESDHSLMNAVGTTLTTLRPSGTIVINDERVDAVSEGVFIEAKRPVRVTQVHGSRVVVEPIEDE